MVSKWDRAAHFLVDHPVEFTSSKYKNVISLYIFFDRDLCTDRSYFTLRYFYWSKKQVDGGVGKVCLGGSSRSSRVPRRRRVYLRPVRGCIKVGCVLAALAGCCLGLLTLVLLLANSSRIVWGMSGSNLTPCCKIAHKKCDCVVKNAQVCYIFGGCCLDRATEL